MKTSNSIKNRYYYKEKRETSYLYVITKCGSTSDGKKYGLTHFIEHFNIHRLKNEIGKNTQVYDNVSIGGVTYYDHTMYVISFEDNLDTFKEIYCILRDIFDINKLNYIDIKEIKNEVIEEYYAFEEKWCRELQITKTITNNGIKNIPVGESDIIKNINFEDIKSFFKNNYKENSIYYFLNSKNNYDDEFINIEEFEKYTSFENNFNNGNPIRNIDMCDETIYIRDKSVSFTEIKYLFRIKYVQITKYEKLLRTVYEYLVTDYLYDTLKNLYDLRNIVVTDKHISNDYYYSSITIQTYDENIDDESIKGILINLRNMEINQHQYDNCIKKINSILEVLCKEKDNRNSVLNNVISFILYNEPLHVSICGYNDFLELLKNIKLEDINNYKNNIIMNDCKVVHINN